MNCWKPADGFGLWWTFESSESLVMHSSVSTERRGQEEVEVKIEGEEKERRHSSNLSNALSRQRAYKWTLMCLCLYGLILCSCKERETIYISLYLKISSRYPLNDVYSSNLLEKWVSQRHTEDLMSRKSLCFSKLDLYQQYFEVVPPAVDSTCLLFDPT